MKNLMLFIAVQCCTLCSFTQISPNSPLTWMKGDNTIDQFGNYGTQGIADSANKPGARNFSTTWRDDAGNLWLFGGSGYANSKTGFLNDLWKYDPAGNKWSWMNGDSATGKFGIYGTERTASSANRPGAVFSGVSWKDANNTLWLFGGFGFANSSFGFLNTLWKYDPSSNEWTWIKGDSTIDQPGNYGTQGIENASNKPGARYGSQTWTDRNGNLWLYGGYGFDETSSGILNDIWKYDPVTNNWTWIKGDSLVEQTGIYGVKGVAGAANKPGARYVCTSWKDNNDNLWLFGGYGYDEANSGNLNDLWKYDPVTNQWTWINGDNIVDQKGSYGTIDVPDNTNKPGSRYVSSCWIDKGGAFWLFGGYGYDDANSGYLNDLWKYDPVSNMWTWVKGDNIIDQVGVYGTQSMPDSSNKLGGRTGSVSWTDGNGNLWLFGGYGFDGSSSGVLNDLWKINNNQPQVVLPPHILRFTAVLNNEIAMLQWQTERETNFSHFNIQRSFDGINYTTIGSVNGAGNSYRNNYNWNDDSLKNIQWQKVFYRLQLMSKGGDFSYSKTVMFDKRPKATILTIFPNPVVSSLNLSFVQNKAGNVVINVTDIRGITVMKQTETVNAGRVSLSIDLGTLPAAAYLVFVTNGEFIAQRKLIKQ
ncbi:MAG: T9SS type A sorting domain-containing protein [Sphingobacteriales bacterium]|nr:T9SS type A sorting domain-containing protein [Sphingobacteriales bacterium]